MFSSAKFMRKSKKTSCTSIEYEILLYYPVLVALQKVPASWKAALSKRAIQGDL
jgi:hypothetical protein